MDDIIIKVDTAVLASVSNDAKGKIKAAQQAFEELENVINRTAGYWEGMGHDAMKNAYGIRGDDYQRIFNGLYEHVDNLLKIGGVYEENERGASETAQILPTDVIF